MIKDLFHKNRPIYSLEVFPPKKDADVSVTMRWISLRHCIRVLSV